MDEILKDLDFSLAYIDDILFFSTSPQEHDQQLYSITKLRHPAEHLQVCFPFLDISFQGYKISSMGSQPLPKSFLIPRPITSQNSQSTGATIQAPLHDVLSGTKVKGSHLVTWSEALVSEFNECKACQSRAGLLDHPHPNARLPGLVRRKDICPEIAFSGQQYAENEHNGPLNK